jgi:hypothetical protein
VSPLRLLHVPKSLVGVMGVVAALSVLTPAAGATVSPNLGKTTVGANINGGFQANVERVNAYRVPAAGTITKLSVYLQPTSTSGQQTLKSVIYADVNGAPRTLLAVSSQLAFASTETAGWYDLPLPTPLSVQPGTLWLGIISGGTSGVAGFRWDSVANARDVNSRSYSSGPSNPFGSFSVDGEQMSLYATYTPTSTSAPQNTALPLISGKPQQGYLLSATTGGWSNSPTSDAYQWQHCNPTCSNIAGATASTYTPAAGDGGYTIRVLVTATNTGGASAPATSAETGAVTRAASYEWLGSYNAIGQCPNVPLPLDAYSTNPMDTYSIGTWVGSHVHCVADPLGSGQTVAQYDIANSDNPPGGNGNPRADVASPRLLGPGHDYYVSTPIYLPSSTPVPGSSSVHGGAMLWEIYGLPYGGSPATALNFTAGTAVGDPTHNYLRIGGTVDGAPGHFEWYSPVPVSGPGVAAAWHTVIVHVYMSATADAGYLQVWFDGARQSFTSCTIGSRNHCSTDSVLANDQYNYTTLVSGVNWDGTDWNWLDINSYRPPCTEFPEVAMFCGTLTTYRGAPAIGPTYGSVASTLYGTTGP